MRLVSAIIRPSRLDEVQRALSAEGIVGVTVTEVKGFGRQHGHTEIYRGAEYTIRFLPKLKIEVVVPSDRVEKTILVLREAAATGRIGDGKIFVMPVDHAMRIRTGETDREAL